MFASQVYLTSILPLPQDRDSGKLMSRLKTHVVPLRPEHWATTVSQISFSSPGSPIVSPSIFLQSEVRDLSLMKCE